MTSPSAERPAGVTRAVRAAVLTALAQLIVTAGVVALGTWTVRPGEEEGSALGGSILVAWGLISAVLLVVAALLTLRRRNAGRVMFFIVGGIALANHLACGVYNGIVGAEIAKLTGDGRPTPPMWMAALGMAGAVLGIFSAIAGLSHYGRRTTRDWLEPPRAYLPVPPHR